MVREFCADEDITHACSEALTVLEDVYRNLRYFKSIKVVEVGQGEYLSPEPHHVSRTP
jgi:hypothetical protein